MDQTLAVTAVSLTAGLLWLRTGVNPIRAAITALECVLASTRLAVELAGICWRERRRFREHLEAVRLGR